MSVKNLNECRNICPTCQNIGGCTRLSNDDCAYNQKVRESTAPLMHQLSRFKFENDSRCTYDGKLYAPFDLVDEESELKGIVRPVSKCASEMYHPGCNSNNCRSTYSKNVPIIYPPTLCPIVCNNIKKMTHPGYVLQKRGDN